MKLSRLIRTGVVCCMSLALLAGCSGGGTTTAPAASSGSTEAASTEAGGASASGGREGGTALTFTTGGDQGTYYGFGGVIAGKVGETTSTTVTAITSGGSAANIEALQAGDAQIGFSQSDVLAYAYEGTRTFEETGAVTNFSIVADLYMEQVQIVTLDENIKTVEDLRGKNVSIGAAGSGTYFNAVDVLSVYGMTENDINPTYQSFGDSAEALQDGKIDAAFIVAGAPTTAVTSLSTTKQVYLVSIDDAHIDQLISEYPYYSKNTIAADAYGLSEDVSTVAVGAVVIANDEVSEDDIYNFCWGVYENIDSITAAHDKGKELDINFAASVTTVPYHPGAAAYYAEKGITVPSK